LEKSDTTDKKTDVQWTSVHDLILIFSAIGVRARKAVALWRHGVRSASRLAALTSWEAEQSDINEHDKTLLDNFVQTNSRTSPSSTTPLRKDHPVIAPTARGSRVGAKLALCTQAGRAAALDDIDDLVDAPSAKLNSTHRYETWCELLEPFGERPMPVTPEKVRMVAAGLRKGGFRSASAYFGAACIEHLKTYGQRPGCLVTYSMARYSRAVSRGIGPSAGKASFNLEDLVDAMTAPTPEMVATVSSDCLWPCGVACLGAWWMTRSIELTAARVKDIEINDSLQRVHWALPASKTDVQALGVSRSHCCLCSSHPQLVLICPFHTAKTYLGILKNTFGASENFEDSPLFPNGNGAPLTHSASVRLIRAAAAASGDSLAYQPGRFGEHALRVSGAQFMSRVLLLDVYVIQLYGRWASKTVARYVQDAPLSRPLPTQIAQKPAITLEVVVKMVTNLLEKKMALADAVNEVSKDNKELSGALNNEVLAILDTAKSNDQDAKKVTQVMNKATKVTHIVLSGPDDGIPSNKFLARCGWRFGFVLHAFTTDDEPANICKTCYGLKTRKRKAAESEASSSSSSDND